MQRLTNRLNNIQEVCTLSSLQDVNTDLILTLCGEKIGSGIYRTVYEYNLDPEKYVVKIEPLSTEANMSEYLLWYEIQGLTGDLAWVKDWFAPIKYLSPNGKVLIMRRTRENRKKDRPKQVPNFFTDVKWDNFGWIGDKFVCHDYGFLYKFIQYKSKMQNTSHLW